jgi:hypothetical protein
MEKQLKRPINFRYKFGNTDIPDFFQKFPGFKKSENNGYGKDRIFS